MAVEFIDVESLAARIPDGALVAIGKTECGAAMEATRALIRRGAKGLRLLTLPTSGLQADLLIGAGCLASLETSGITLGEYGPPPCFTRAVKTGTLPFKDATCPAIYASLQAGEKGLPFMPIRGLIGSDILTFRPDLKIIDNPFAKDDPIVVVPAVRPDIAFFHAPVADRQGNVWIGRQRPLAILAHAARETFVTVEEITEKNLLDDEDKGPSTIPSLYVTAIARAEKGAWPLGLARRYDEDADHIREYCRLAATEDGLKDYLQRYVRKPCRAAAE